MACDPRYLPETPEWQALTFAEKEVFAQGGNPQSYIAGETIYRQGEECRGIYVVRGGLVSRHREDADGRVVTLHLARKDDILGYRPVLAGEAHMSSAEVIEECQVCFYPTAHVKETLMGNLDFGLALLQREAHELGQAEARFQEAVTQHLRIRLLHLLLDLRKDFGSDQSNGDVLLDFPFSRQEMASMIGVRVETLSREIRHLTDDGLVKFSGHRAWIKNLTAIRQEVAAQTLPH